MIPKPPFPKDLTLEQEIAEFELLKPRLDEVWNALTYARRSPPPRWWCPRSPSTRASCGKLAGSSFYEERLLFLLIRLRNPRARMVYVTSQPVHPMILEYYFQFLAGIPACHARARLTLLCAYDASPRSLTEKILERPRLHRAHPRRASSTSRRAYLTVFNSTPLERKLAVLLGIPLNGVDPRLTHLGTKSGSRKVFREAGRGPARGLRGPAHRARRRGRRWTSSRRAARASERAVVKLNDSFSGEGNALYRYPEELPAGAPRGDCGSVEFSVPTETPEVYLDKFARMGGIVEEFIDAEREELALGPAPHRPERRGDGDLHPRPAPRRAHGPDLPRLRLPRRRRLPDGGSRRRALRVGAACWPRTAWSAASRVDFLAYRDDRPRAVVDLRARDQPAHGRHHAPLPRPAVPHRRRPRPATGLFRSPTGHAKYYRATDNLHSEQLPRPAARGPDRDPHRQPPALLPRHASPACSST